MEAEERSFKHTWDGMSPVRQEVERLEHELTGLYLSLTMGSTELEVENRFKDIHKQLDKLKDLVEE